MKKVISYNFDETISNQTDWPLFYKTRRDSNFGAVFQITPDEYVAIRDHLGTIPIYYRFENGKIDWSFNYNDLIRSDDKPSAHAIQSYLGFSSAKVTTVIDDIHLVPPGTVLSLTKTKTTALYTYKMDITPIRISKSEAKIQLLKLLEIAVERTIKSDAVGLYLSGGMDSGLIGQILKTKGIKVNAYTALPWGKAGTEYTYAKINNALINPVSHTYVDIEPAEYKTYLQMVRELYRTPHGTTTSINIAGLWHKTDIQKERQVFFAQNTDTLTSSVPAQVNAIIMSYIPRNIRRRFVDMPLDTVVENYLYHCTKGLVTHHENETYISDKLDKIGKIAQAGMYIAHSQSDSEAINAPSIATHQLSANPYYDMDLIEFYLSLPTRYKVAYNKETKTLISIEKDLFRQVALTYLPKELVYRKKAFVLPKDRNSEATDFFNTLDTSLQGVHGRNRFERLSLAVIRHTFDSLRE